MQLKMYKYAGAGVREYWMVDPEKKLVVQYDLEHLEIPAIYNFQSVIPVLIWDGACTIDLGEMDETIGFCGNCKSRWRVPAAHCLIARIVIGWGYK